MAEFDFVFSLYGLLLGLSLAEVLGGFGRAVQKRRKVRIGWLAPLLGLIVLLDVSSFWLVAWAARDEIPIALFPLICGLVICGLYYLVATLVFPHDLDEWPDLDRYYFAHKRHVIVGVIGCNALALGALMAVGISPLSGIHAQVSVTIFLAAAAGLLLAKGKRVNTALLAFMVLQYPAGSVLAGW